jgi:hypothetical protein
VVDIDAENSLKWHPASERSFQCLNAACCKSTNNFSFGLGKRIANGRAVIAIVSENGPILLFLFQMVPSGLLG